VLATISVRRQSRRFLAAYNEAIAAIARGELERARRMLWEWAESTTLSGASAYVRHSLGWTLLRQGELQQAAEVLNDNEERNRETLAKIALDATSAADLAFAYALMGKIEDAETWFATASERGKARTQQPTFPAMKTFARATIDCRAGRHADAARLLAESWPECESLFTGETLRPLRVVRAFAQATGGVRDAGMVGATLGELRPLYPGEFDFLGSAWPEMQTFLVTHTLVRPRSAPGAISPEPAGA
jgi:hypothetical protein